MTEELLDLEETIRMLKRKRSLARGCFMHNHIMAVAAKKSGTRSDFAAYCEGAAAGHQWCVNEIQYWIDLLESKSR